LSLKETKKWFEQAIPAPTTEQACIQIGCHFEEVGEMQQCLGNSSYMNHAADYYKTAPQVELSSISSYSHDTRIELLDSLVDQIVTAVGVGHMLGMDVLGALEEVNRSNFSKFEEGEAVFDENGKITKGKDYKKPNLKPFV
jgi:predicted HAD superfamily Cof-like phosphohydrolase